MLSAFSHITTVKIIGLILALLWVSFCLVGWLTVWPNFHIAVIKTFLPAAGVTGSILNFRWAISAAIRFWNKIPGLKKIPDLNGSWLVQLESNWPRIKHLIERNGLDGLTAIPLLKKQGTLSLEMNFFKVTGQFLSDDTQDRSIASRTRRSKIVAASVSLDENNAYLRFMADATVVNINPKTDSERHYFATELVFEDRNIDNASGSYWTNRKYESGLNTAGTINISRPPPDSPKKKCCSVRKR